MKTTLKQFRKPASFFLVILSTVFLVSCNQESVSNAGSTARTEHTINIPYGKPGAPVSASYSIPSTINAGDNFNINLNLTTKTPFGKLRAKLNTDKELTLHSSDDFTFSIDGNEMPISVELEATKNGLFYLYLNVHERLQNSELMGRSFAIPVQVGPVQPKKKTQTNYKVNNGERPIEEMIVE